MWKRFVRAIKALFGGAVQAIEDPKLILEQNIRELNDQVPKMNESIATVKSSVIMLEKDVARQQKEHDTLVSKIKAAIQNGRDEIAANFALRLESVKSNLAETKQELTQAERAYEKSLEVKKAFMKERERKIKEAQDALRAHERSKWQSRIADTMESFEVGGLDQTHDEMVTRLNEKTAKNEARIEMAVDSLDTESIKLEEEAENLRAMDLVNQYKMEMGVGAESADTQTTNTEEKEQEG